MLEYLCDRVDNSANKQDLGVWPHDVIAQKQAATGVRKVLVRHPEPQQPHGFVYHPNNMMLVRRLSDSMARNIYLAAKRSEELTLYLGSPTPTTKGVPGDPRIVDLAVEALELDDWLRFDLHVEYIHQPLVDSGIFAVIYDAQSLIPDHAPWRHFYRLAGEQLGKRHVHLGVESPPHPVDSMDWLRELTSVSGSTYPVWSTNRERLATYPAAHLPFVFIEVTDSGPVQDADVIRQRAQEVADWAVENERDVRIVANWTGWAKQAGATDPTTFTTWINTRN